MSRARPHRQVTRGAPVALRRRVAPRVAPSSRASAGWKIPNAASSRWIAPSQIDLPCHAPAEMPVRACVEVSDRDSQIYQPPPAPFTPPNVAGNYLCDQGAALSYMTAQGGGSVARG